MPSPSGMGRGPPCPRAQGRRQALVLLGNRRQVFLRVWGWGMGPMDCRQHGRELAQTQVRMVCPFTDPGKTGLPPPHPGPHTPHPTPKEPQEGAEPRGEGSWESGGRTGQAVRPLQPPAPRSTAEAVGLENPGRPGFGGAPPADGPQRPDPLL